MEKLFYALLAPALFFALTGLCGAQDPKSLEKCEVSGAVTDTRGYVVPGMHIIFEQGKMTEMVDSDFNGEYKIEIAPGIYDVLLKRGVSFARYRRARYRVSCPDRQTLNLTYLPECYSWGCTDLGYSFATLYSDWTRNGRLNAVISYDTKRRSGSRITYKDTMLTFNQYTFAGKRIIQNSKLKTLVIEGPGWIDDGKTRREFKSVKVKFTKDGISLEETQ